MSRDVLTNVAIFLFPFSRQSQDIRESVARHSCECRLVLFSRHIVAMCSYVFSRLLHDIRTSVTKISHCKFAKISRRQVRDSAKNVIRLSHDSLAKYFGKRSHNIFKHVLNLRDQFTKIRTTLVRMSCENPRLNSQNRR